MKTAHAGMGITEDEWNLAVEHLTATLDTFNEPEAERNELFALLTTLKPDIVEKM